MCSVFLPGMIERGSGHLINMGSVAGHYAYATGSGTFQQNQFLFTRVTFCSIASILISIKTLSLKSTYVQYIIPLNTPCWVLMSRQDTTSKGHLFV